MLYKLGRPQYVALFITYQFPISKSFIRLASMGKYPKIYFLFLLHSSSDYQKSKHQSHLTTVIVIVIDILPAQTPRELQCHLPSVPTYP